MRTATAAKIYFITPLERDGRRRLSFLPHIRYFWLFLITSLFIWLQCFAALFGLAYCARKAVAAPQCWRRRHILAISSTNAREHLMPYFRAALPFNNMRLHMPFT